MKKTLFIKFGYILVLLFFCVILNAQQLMGDFFPTGSKQQQQETGPTEISSKSMDIDLKNNSITLQGNVIVDNESTKISADKIMVLLANAPAKQMKRSASGSTTKDKKESLVDAGRPDSLFSNQKTKKEVKRLVATGNVVIIKKPGPEEKGKYREEKATAGKAVYNMKTGIIVLTINPIMRQGDSYIRGKKITLFRDSGRVKVEGSQSMGQQQGSKLIFKPDEDEFGQ